MKIRVLLYINSDDEPDTIFVPLNELDFFIKFIKKYGITNGDGAELSGFDITYNSFLGCVDVSVNENPNK